MLSYTQKRPKGLKIKNRDKIKETLNSYYAKVI